MDERRAPEPRETAGQDFVRRIGPAGCVLFLALAILVAALCLTSGRDPVPGYEAPHDSEYYVNHLDELADELNEHFLPRLDTPATAAVSGGAVAVTVEGDSFVLVRSAVLRYFDESLFVFQTA